MAEPAASRRARPVRARATVTGAPWSEPAGSGPSATSSSTVTGPATSRWPPTHSASQSSSPAVGSLSERSTPSAISCRSVAAQLPPTRPARPSARRASNHGCHSGTGRQRTSESRRSWSSSASAGTGAHLVQYLGRGHRVEGAELRGRHRKAGWQPVGSQRSEASGHRDGPGPALLQGRSVEEGERAPGQDPVGQGRRLHRLDQVDGDPAGLQPAQEGRPAPRRRGARSGSRSPSGERARGRAPAPGPGPAFS